MSPFRYRVCVPMCPHASCHDTPARDYDDALNIAEGHALFMYRTLTESYQIEIHEGGVIVETHDSRKLAFHARLKRNESNHR